MFFHVFSKNTVTHQSQANLQKEVHLMPTPRTTSSSNPIFSYSQKFISIAAYLEGLHYIILQYIFFSMKRNSIRKASTFKMQIVRSRFQAFLENIENCSVARRWPCQLDVHTVLWKNIQSSSEKVFEMCYSFNDDSPFVRALNYDNRFYGFQSIDNRMTFRDYLGPVKQAYLYGDFNDFDRSAHRLEMDKEKGDGWFQTQFDQNEFRVDDGSRVMVRVITEQGKEYEFPPPSCYFIKQNYGIFRQITTKSKHFSKHKLTHLLAYTIDLQIMPLSECLSFIESEMDLLSCYNTVILKNLFKGGKDMLHKFSLSVEKADQMQLIIEQLSVNNIKVVLQWNFDEGDLPQEKSPLQIQYFKETSSIGYQFDLEKESVLTYYLGSIAHYIKYFGLGGIHFTKVHRICKEKNGRLLAKLINVLCQRLRQDCITLASSREFIPGLNEPILDGGLGFSFTYNFRQSLSLEQQHQSLYQMVKQIQSSSNCLSLTFEESQQKSFIYILFTFFISKKGVFTRGSVAGIRESLKKALKIRRQEELFTEQSVVEKMDEDCMIVSRGSNKILFNFSDKSFKFDLPFDFEQSQAKILFNKLQTNVDMQKNAITITPYNCIILQTK